MPPPPCGQINALLFLDVHSLSYNEEYECAAYHKAADNVEDSCTDTTGAGELDAFAVDDLSF